MNNRFQELGLKIDALTVFEALKQDPVIRGLREVFSLLEEQRNARDRSSVIRAYTAAVSALFQRTSDLSEYICLLVLGDDNFYVRSVAAGIPLSDEITSAARRELNFLQDLGGLSCQEIVDETGYDGYLPRWTNSSIHLITDFMNKLEALPVTGYGMYADYRFFRVAADEIVPVSHPDVQPLEQLFGYEREQEMIIRNTEALLSGSGASNMLLYGDAGTGKSSTIKAVAARYADQGLRLIEIKKSQLVRIPKILEELSSNPLKFILFIDDLSFSENDDSFAALKATLEGSVAGRGINTVIYATSNRRHLVRENFGDREGDELHVNDTLQETMSLAGRFGLTITFQTPDKEEYLRIVSALAKEYDLDLPQDELYRRAEAHAIRRNGRSPRTARQFVELQSIGL